MCDCCAAFKVLVPVVLWMVFWLGAVNWQKAWPILAQGGWAPFVLLGLTGAGVWSLLDPAPCDCLRFVTIPRFWWHLGSVGGLFGLALFCGWLQGLLHWAPPVYPTEPVAGEDAGHGHH